MEVTLLGFELEIVARKTVPDPPPDRLLRARMPRMLARALDQDPWETYPVEEFRYTGMGIYRRVK